MFAAILLPQLLLSQLIDQVVLRVDTMIFTSAKNTVFTGGTSRLIFQYQEEEQVVDVTIKLRPQAVDYHFSMIPSADFRMLDSLVRLENLLRFKVRFNQLSSSEFLRFSFQVTEGEFNTIETVHLQPVHP